MRYISGFLSRLRSQKAREYNLLDYLEHIGTRGIPHYRQSLFDHLRGTYEILKRWGCPENVCVAGLFHSVYGTQPFRIQTIAYAQRREVRMFIGKRAERLVYLFSISDRPSGLVHAVTTGKLVNRFDQTEFVINAADLADLIAIECANLINQEGSVPFFGEIYRAVIQARFPIDIRIKEILTRYA